MKITKSDVLDTLTDLTHGVKRKVTIGALVGLSLGTYLRHDVLSDRNAVIPLAFSENGAITRMLKAKGQTTPNATEFYSLGNDYLSKVFESHNESMKIGPNDKIFANELETRVDKAQRVFPLITEIHGRVMGAAQRTRQDFQKLVEIRRSLPSANNALDASWDTPSHVDKTRKEKRTRTCDPMDKSCTPEYEVDVYDHSEHTYTYHGNAGTSAASQFTQIVKQHPDLTVDDRLITARYTQADNEWAIYSSHKRLLEKMKKFDFTREEYLAFANTWATGSTLAVNRGDIKHNHGSLKNLTPAWRNASKTARSVYFETSTTSYTDPREYTVAENTLTTGRKLEKDVAEIVDGLDFFEQNAPRLIQMIKDYIETAHFGDQNKATQMREQIMSLSKEMYMKNFKGGFQVEAVQWNDIAIFAFLGGLLGAGAGWGAQKLLEALEERKRASFQRDYTA